MFSQVDMERSTVSDSVLPNADGLSASARIRTERRRSASADVSRLITVPIFSRVRSRKRQVSKASGGVPPFGHTTQLRVFVDPDLLQYDEVWAAAGTWNDNFGASPADIVRVAGGVVTDLKRA